MRMRTMTKSLARKAMRAIEAAPAVHGRLRTTWARSAPQLTTRFRWRTRPGFDPTQGRDCRSADALSFRGPTGQQLENRWSHCELAVNTPPHFGTTFGSTGCCHSDESRSEEDEKHIHRIQSGSRASGSRSCGATKANTVLSPLAGVRSEDYGAVTTGRRGVGIELKRAYYAPELKFMESATDVAIQRPDMFAGAEGRQQERAIVAPHRRLIGPPERLGTRQDLTMSALAHFPPPEVGAVPVAVEVRADQYETLGTIAGPRRMLRRAAAGTLHNARCGARGRTGEPAEVEGLGGVSGPSPSDPARAPRRPRLQPQADGLELGGPVPRARGPLSRRCR